MVISTRTAPVTPRRSVIVSSRRSETIRDSAQPRDPGPNEVLLQITRNGICASERPAWLRGPEPGSAPATIGHEPVGIIRAAGVGAERFREGDVVTGRVASSLADLVIASTEDLVKVPANVTGDAAIGEPLGCIVEAVRRTPLDVGDRVAIVGLGFMGLCLLDLIVISGVSEIVAIDPRAEAQQLALRRGAAAVFAPGDIALDSMSNSFDVVFEVSGSQSGLNLSTTLASEHGTLSLVGYHQGSRTVDVQAWNWKALDVVNGHVRDQRRLVESTERGLALVAAGRIPYGDLFTHHYSLDQIDQALEDLESKPTGFVKAVVVLND
ncbi:zinc-binding dehydrogenase [Microbacterium sp. NPDC058389]|uniref:zinc-binding dehydrogenase n=1 Tax=Microbacterium sp. NPDC058389 TaxID=3346475 RepID=UPI00365A81E2